MKYLAGILSATDAHLLSSIFIVLYIDPLLAGSTSPHTLVSKGRGR